MRSVEILEMSYDIIQVFEYHVVIDIDEGNLRIPKECVLDPY